MEKYPRMTERKRGWLPTIARCSCFIFIALFGLSCSEEPTDLNSPTSPIELPGLTVRDTTIEASHDSTFKTYAAMGANNITNLVGSTQGYTAISVLRFFPTPRDTVNVVSAALRLRLAYRFGDAAGPFSFDVYRVTRSWNQATATWDSISTNFYDASSKHGSFSQALASDSGYITVDLDTAMVRQWVSSTAAEDQRYGIALVPTPSSSVRGFVQFLAAGDSTAYLPTLEVVATNASGTTRDTTNYTTGIGTFAADVSLPADPGILNVQAGIVYRSKLTFDVSFIPRGTIINSAILSLDVAPGSTRLNSFTKDTVVQAQMDLSDNPSDLETGAIASLKPTASAFTTAAGDISHAVQSWVRGPNYGLVLRNNSPAETARLDLYGFYGVRASSAGVRPRLKITYSLGNH